MADSHRMAEDAQDKLHDAAEQVSDKAHDFADQAGETFRKASDRVNQSARDGLKTARQFAETAQKYVDQSGLADMDVRELVARDPWIARRLCGRIYVAAQIMRRISE